MNFIIVKMAAKKDDEVYRVTHTCPKTKVKISK